MIPDGNPGLSYQHRPQQCRATDPNMVLSSSWSWMELWLQVAAQTMEYCVTFGGNRPWTSTQSQATVSPWTQACPSAVACTRISEWPQEAAQDIQINLAPVDCRAPRQMNGIKQQSRPQTSEWFSVATWAMDIYTDPSCERAMDPDMAFVDSPDPDIPMAPGGSTGHSIHVVPANSRTPGQQHGFKRQ